jgi:hypothetical protein
MQALRELVDVKQHRTHHIKKIATVIAGTALDHHAHGLQHGSQRGVFVTDDLQTAVFFHRSVLQFNESQCDGLRACLP